MKNVIFALSFGLVLLFILLSGKTNLYRSKAACKKVSGIVASIYEDGTKDAIFQIKGQNTVFYINRALDKNINIPSLSEKLTGKVVNIFYLDNWNPLGSIGDSKAISELSTNQELVFTELENN